MLWVPVCTYICVMFSRGDRQKVFEMAASPGFAVAKKLVENLQTDLRSLSSECRRKYPPVKEVRICSLTGCNTAILMTLTDSL